MTVSIFNGGDIHGSTALSSIIDNALGGDGVEMGKHRVFPFEMKY
jgi:hypothetical protein